MVEGKMQAIDVHAHFGGYVAEKHELINKFMSATANEVVRRACIAETQLTIVSPLKALLPRLKGDPLAANKEAAQIISKTEGLLQCVVVDPTKPDTYAQATEMLELPKCVGIKIHPEEHGYYIKEYGRAIFEFAARHKTVVQTHSGEQKSLPADFVQLANDFPEVILILSHLGCGWNDDPTHQICAIGSSQHGNVFTDTSSSQSMTSNLIEWAVSEVGAEHILYGSDSPLYFAPMQRARIDYADISEQDRKLILHGNAARLFGLEDQETKGL